MIGTKAAYHIGLHLAKLNHMIGTEALSKTQSHDWYQGRTRQSSLRKIESHDWHKGT